MEATGRRRSLKYSFSFLDPHFLDIQIEQNTIAPLPLTHGVVLTSTFFHTQQDNKAINMGISVCPIFSPYFESLDK